MTRVIKPPTPLPDDLEEDPRLVVFLGGTIDMGASVDWQTMVANRFDDSFLFLNPRRDEWDSSWEQDPTPGTKFHEQVTWEMDAQDAADINFYYIIGSSKSPITLLEIGGWSPHGNSIVVCEPEFYRFGNVKMFCDRYSVPFFENLTLGLIYLDRLATTLRLIDL